jgi:hypothetical protein
VDRSRRDSRLIAHGEAEKLTAPTDYLPLKAFVAMKRAEAARLAERGPEEREALEEALLIASQKGDLVTAGRARARLDELRS